MHTIFLVLITLLATHTTGHGHVTNVVINGVSYRGFDINSDPYNSNPPVVIAWAGAPLTLATASSPQMPSLPTM